MMEEQVFKIYWPNVIISSFPIWLGIVSLYVFRNNLFQDSLLGVVSTLGVPMAIFFGMFEVLKRLKEVRIAKNEIAITNILTKSQIRIPVEQLTEVRYNMHSGEGKPGKGWDLMEFHFKEPDSKFTQIETIVIWSIQPTRGFFQALSEMPCECTRNGAWSDFKELAKGL
jgi:hypothetical protein